MQIVEYKRLTFKNKTLENEIINSESNNEIFDYKEVTSLNDELTEILELKYRRDDGIYYTF